MTCLRCLFHLMPLVVGTTITSLWRMCNRCQKNNKKEKQMKRILNAPKFLALVVSVGKVRVHYQISICNVIGSYSSRCKCLKAPVGCDGNCTYRGCSNLFRKRQTAAAEMECAPRKRRKFDIQNSSKLNSQAYLEAKGETATRWSIDKGGVFCSGRTYKTVS